MQRKLMGIINLDFDATGQLLIIYSAFIKYLRKKQVALIMLIIALQFDVSTSFNM